MKLNAAAPWWSTQQQRAIVLARQSLRDRDRQVFHLSGYAGTGKTTLAKEVGSYKNSTAFCAYTGKAAHVMRQRGCEPVSTIHKLIYHPVYDEQTGRWFYVRKERDELAHIGLVVLDEASMVNDRLANDLLSFDIPTLVIDDPAQLTTSGCVLRLSTSSARSYFNIIPASCRHSTSATR